MKKIISVITAVVLLTVLIFTGKSYAASLDAIDIQTDKTTVRPGEEVKVTINFGETLGAYTFDIAYDNNIFEYVSVDGGTPNDTSDKVRVVFHDSSGGTNSRANMSITFRAKSDITTSNPTEFSITAEGLANADASVTYDDITTPIVKNVTVEPQNISTPPEEITPPAETPGTTEEEEKIENEIVNQETNEEINQEETPTKLPKTGYNVYVPILVILMAVLSSYLYYNKKRK